MYGIIIDENEIEGLDLNCDSASSAAEHLELEEYMTNFSIEEYNDGSGSYNTILVLAGDFKPEVIKEYGLRDLKKEILDLDGIKKIIEL